MGTPEFAVPTLELLIQNGYEVVAVVTATDKLGGRGGKQPIQSPVKQYALQAGIPILQPEKLKAPEFVEALKSYYADLQIVVAFRMLPEVVWSMPRLGTMNLHGSILPKYRGAAPINWAIIHGEKETGVTTFFLKHEIDTGDVLMVEKLAIGENDTAGIIHDKMMVMGAETVLQSVRLVESGHYTLQSQQDIEASHAPKIFNETCEIDFRLKVDAVHNFVRGLSPFPTAWTSLNGLKLKVFMTNKEVGQPNHAIGAFVTDQKTFIKVACSDGYIHLLDLQLEGRKRMDVKSFLNGYTLHNPTTN